MVFVKKLRLFTFVWKFATVAKEKNPWELKYFKIVNIPVDFNLTWGPVF